MAGLGSGMTLLDEAPPLVPWVEVRPGSKTLVRLDSKTLVRLDSMTLVRLDSMALVRLDRKTLEVKVQCHSINSEIEDHLSRKILAVKWHQHQTLALEVHLHHRIYTFRVQLHSKNFELKIQLLDKAARIDITMQHETSEARVRTIPRTT